MSMAANKADDENVIHNPGAERFEIQVDGLLAVLQYRLDGNRIIFTHTGVPKALEGQWLGSRLVRAGLEYARKNGIKVRSTCWFVDGYLKRHKEYQDLAE